MWKKILLFLLLATLAFVFVGCPYALAHLITSAGTRPMDLRITTTPKDFGVAFESVSFPAEDGVPISGWYLEGGETDLAVAVGHGLFRSRQEVLDRAVFFAESGVDTLVFDFRRHGESEGERISLGYQERLDFDGAVDVLRQRRPDGKLVLYGVSMGAVAALLSAAETPEVEAVIIDSPFLSIDQTVSHHVKLIFGLPRFPFASTLLFFLEMRGGFDSEDFDLEQAVRRLGGRPVLIIAGGQDQRMPVDVSRRLYEASESSSSRFEVFPSARHGAAYRTDRDRYEQLLTSFLDSVRGTGQKAGSGEER